MFMAALHRPLEMKPHFVFEDPRVVRMKNVQRPVLCYFLVENKKRAVRRRDLLKRVASSVGAPRAYEVKRGDQEREKINARKEFSLSTVSEENELTPVEKSDDMTTPLGQESEHHSEYPSDTVPETVPSDTGYQKGDPVAERPAVVAVALTSSIVWLVVAVLIAIAAIVAIML